MLAKNEIWYVWQCLDYGDLFITRINQAPQCTDHIMVWVGLIPFSHNGRI